MEFSSKILENAVNQISLLPGIGKRTAFRLVLHLLKQPKEQTSALVTSLTKLREEIKYCKSCHTLSDHELCNICSNTKRDQLTICVVEEVQDVMAIENTGIYKGVYHVLGGKISPIDGVGPHQLHIESLIEKLNNNKVNEVIFALSSTIEADTTMFYISKQIVNKSLKTTVIAKGISVGDELQYADEVTLGRSLLNRIPYEFALD